MVPAVDGEASREARVVDETMLKRVVLKEDGRRLVYYSFEPRGEKESS